MSFVFFLCLYKILFQIKKSYMLKIGILVYIAVVVTGFTSRNWYQVHEEVRMQFELFLAGQYISGPSCFPWFVSLFLLWILSSVLKIFFFFEQKREVIETSNVMIFSNYKKTLFLPGGEKIHLMLSFLSFSSSFYMRSNCNHGSSILGYV